MQEVVEVEKSRQAIKVRRPETLGKRLVWTLASLPEFYWLCENPPLHSVVATIHPDVANVILTHHNNRNRPLSPGAARRYEFEFVAGDFVVTGDTIKFGRSGELLDGQHRLQACVDADKPFSTHVVFGIDDAVFDVLDAGKVRTRADALAIEGVAYSQQVANAVRWAKALELGVGELRGAGQKDGGARRQMAALTPRRIRELVINGEYQGIEDWCNQALQITRAYKHPPSLVTAILFLIARRHPKVAADFVYEWIHGQRSTGRNQIFDTLSSRLINLQRASGGRIDLKVRAALLIITFNHWHANNVPSARALSWSIGQDFPALSFRKDARV